MSGITHLHGDCRELLPTLPDRSVQAIVTSPPYWRMRQYTDDPREIGQEPTPAEYVVALVAVFRECRRVLADDGTLWLNLGDAYADDRKWGGSTGGKHAGGLHGQRGPGRAKVRTGLPPKSLIGLPWRVAFALQDDGWVLRNDIIWHKPNGMPSPATDRCVMNHEYVFLFAKQPTYFFDADAIAEPAVSTSNRGGGKKAQHLVKGPGEFGDGFKSRWLPKGGPESERPQLRRAYELAQQHGLTDAHIAAIRASGISDTGKTAATQTGTGANSAEVQRLAAEAKTALGGYWREFLLKPTRNARSVWSIAPEPLADEHYAPMPLALADRCIRAATRPGDAVLDPFGGSGTTARAAVALGRRAVLIDLGYQELQQRRTDGVQISLDALEAA